MQRFRKLMAESLERRFVLTTVSVFGTELVVEGDSGDNYVTISDASNGLRVRADGATTIVSDPVDSVKVNGNDGRDVIQVHTKVPLVSVEVNGGNGDDYIALSRAISAPAVLSGGNGDDRILSGNGSDTLYGGFGDDRIVGYGGNDVIFGNQGDDYLQGNDGNDVIFGGKDNDFLAGGFGDDYLEGNLGRDTLSGYYGDDLLFGNSSSNRNDGQVDRLYGQASNFGDTFGDNDDGDFWDYNPATDLLV